MPTVSKVIVDEMLAIWPAIHDTRNDLIHPPRPGEYEGARRVVELGNQAALAMIWVYVQDPPLVAPSPGEDAKTVASKREKAVQMDSRNRADMLDELGDDETLVPWLLPIFRARIGVFEEAARAGHPFEVFFMPELDWIGYYLDTHGTDQDLLRTDALYKDLSAIDGVPNAHSPFGRPPMSERRDRLEYQRMRGRANGKDTFASGYEGKVRGFDQLRKVTAENEAKNKKAEQTRLRSNVLPPSLQPYAVTPAKSTTMSQSESTSWGVWLPLVIAAAGTAWVFLRKSK